VSQARRDVKQILFTTTVMDICLAIRGSVEAMVTINGDEIIAGDVVVVGVPNVGGAYVSSALIL